MQRSDQTADDLFVQLGKLGALGCYKISLYFLSLHFLLALCLSVCFPTYWETIWRSAAQKRRGRGVGWEGKRRWRGRGWAGVQSLKISQTDGRKGWATAAQQEHTFDFSYFCCFFHNVWSLPYKLMTKTLLQLRHKKTRRFCHGDFPSHLPTRLLHVKRALISKLFMGLRVTA